MVWYEEEFWLNFNLIFFFQICKIIKKIKIMGLCFSKNDDLEYDNG